MGALVSCNKNTRAYNKVVKEMNENYFLQSNLDDKPAHAGRKQHKIIGVPTFRFPLVLLPSKY